MTASKEQIPANGAELEAAEQVATLDGRTITYRRAGSGPPVLFLHGGWSDSRYWHPQFDGLSGEFDVVAWDAPGCGGSWDPPEDFGMAGYADAAAGLVDALGLEQPHIVGLSFRGRSRPRGPRTPSAACPLARARGGVRGVGRLAPRRRSGGETRTDASRDRPAFRGVGRVLPDGLLRRTRAGGRGRRGRRDDVRDRKSVV